MAVKNRFKRLLKADRKAPRTCLMIGGSGMAGVWIKHFSEAFKERLEIIGLCDVDEEVLRQRGGSLGLGPEQLYTDFRDACATVRADFCAIAIPQEYHGPAAIAAMDHGMPVICEKPLTDTLEAAKEMLRTSQRTGLPCAITQQFRYAPNKQELVRIREEGRLGPLQHVIGRYADDYRRFTSADRPHRRLLSDGCIHHFDMLRFLTGGDCETLMGFAWNPEWSSFDHDSSGFYLMKMTNGVHASLEENGCGAGMTTDWHSYYRAEFEQGTVELTGSDRVSVHRAGRRPKTYRAPRVAWRAHQHLFNEFLEWLDGGPPSATRIEDNIRSFAMAIAANEATIDGDQKRIANYLSDLDATSPPERI